MFWYSKPSHHVKFTWYFLSLEYLIQVSQFEVTINNVPIDYVLEINVSKFFYKSTYKK